MIVVAVVGVADAKATWYDDSNFALCRLSLGNTTRVVPTLASFKLLGRRIRPPRGAVVGVTEEVSFAVGTVFMELVTFCEATAVKPFALLLIVN